ncbi:28663_t:CDS:2, partial [Dentiscutata erythropus]
MTTPKWQNEQRLQKSKQKLNNKKFAYSKTVTPNRHQKQHGVSEENTKTTKMMTHQNSQQQTPKFQPQDQILSQNFSQIQFP